MIIIINITCLHICSASIFHYSYPYINHSMYYKNFAYKEHISHLYLHKPSNWGHVSSSPPGRWGRWIHAPGSGASCTWRRSSHSCQVLHPSPTWWLGYTATPGRSCYTVSLSVGRWCHYLVVLPITHLCRGK